VNIERGFDESSNWLHFSPRSVLSYSGATIFPCLLFSSFMRHCSGAKNELPDLSALVLYITSRPLSLNNFMYGTRLIGANVSVRFCRVDH
jgi:hypothetical protein